MVRVDSTKAAGFDDTVVRKDINGTDLTEKQDQGIGDIEVRVRQNVLAPLSITGKYIPRVTISLGTVMPTGNFIVKEDGGAATSTNKYVSLGRGLWWGLLDVDVFGALFERVGYIVQFAGRTPFGALQNNDGYYFKWGSEVRMNAGFTGVLVPGVLNASLTAELQRRGRGQERVLKELPIDDFPNGGGSTWTLSPTLQAIIGGGFSFSVNARLPVSIEVYGTQPVAGAAFFGALLYSWSAPPPPAKPGLSPGDPPNTDLLRGLVKPGKTTIIDYWATWCEPCKKLAPHLEELATARDDVVLEKVDATDWDADMMKKHLPGAAGLPVVDVFGPDGRLIERLVGPECFKFASRIPAAK